MSHISKISKSVGKFALFLILTSFTIEISKINDARKLNKSENQIFSREYKKILNNVRNLGRFIDLVRARSPILSECGGYNFCGHHRLNIGFRQYTVIMGKMRWDVFYRTFSVVKV